VAPALGELARHHEVVIVHGNGPQVGLLALESQADRTLTSPYPLDALVAETQGMIGYWIQQAVANHTDKPVVTLVSRTLVDADDPAFAVPTKFIGPAYDRPVALELAARYGWVVKPDGDVWRRVVASPEPHEIVEIDAAERLLTGGTTVVLAGGGGVPVVYRGDRLVGVEAVVDKDLAAEIAAEALDADLFVVLTDVPAVMQGFGTESAAPIHEISAAALETLHLPAGSMGPKARAVVRFVRETGRRAAIGALEDLAAVVAGAAGTQVLLTSSPDPEPVS
jgi:carbamate kinase